jgi:hypothetical protein
LTTVQPTCVVSLQRVGGFVRSRVLQVCRKVGWAGMLFFTVKGLLWLLVPAAIAALTTR